MFKFLIDYKRQRYLDILRGIAILLVILGHTGIFKTKYTFFIYVYITSFHMPLFYFVTGYLRKENIPLKVILRKRLRRLMLPWAILSVVSFILYYLITDGTLVDDPVNHAIGYLYSNVLFQDYYNPAIWFLPSLFVTEILYELIIRINGNWKYLVLGGISTVGIYWLKLTNIPLPWNMEVSFVGLAFFCFGNLLAKNQVVIKPYLHNNLILVIILFIQATFILLNYRETGAVNIALSIYGNILFFFGAAITGITFWYGISLRLNMDSLILAGQYTLTLLCTHKIFYYDLPDFICQRFYHLGVHDTLLRGKPIQFMFLIIASLISFYLVRYYEICKSKLTSGTIKTTSCLG